jgi:endonuclease/exonuclease/phosphatase family metal-dependent hydrolase
LLFLVAFSLLTTLVWADPKPSEITIATWNLEWFFDHDDSDNSSALAESKKAPTKADYEWRLGELANAISAMKPTILVLQEVENEKVVNDLADQLKTEHGLDYTVCFIQGQDDYTEQDVAILASSGLQGFARLPVPMALRQDSSTYKTLTKHLMGVFSWGKWNEEEFLTIIVVHLVASGGEAKRMKQAATVRHWIEPLLEYEQNVIVLGDFNSGKKFGSSTAAQSGVGIIMGLGTPSADDDLYDLHNELSDDDQATHLNGNHYDRILVSPSLTTDYDYKDLVFKSIERRQDLVIRQDQDDSHRDRYWQIPKLQRDLSDHYPLVATFSFVD